MGGDLKIMSDMDDLSAQRPAAAATSIRLHGVRRAGDGTGELLFGMHKLLQAIEQQFRPTPKEPCRGSDLWPDVWVDGLFLKGSYKFHRVCWDGLHAAGHLERTIAVVAEVFLRKPRDHSAEIHALNAATRDATIYLEVLIYYFRILADCLAVVVPNLYGRDGMKVKDKARGSFREHCKWFKKNLSFDPAYTAIVNEQTAWFDRIAGENGWRDDLVHRLGTWQMCLSIGETVKLHARIDEGAHPSGPNLLDELTEAVAGCCAYLDATTHHFAQRINTQLTEPMFKTADQRQWGCVFIEGGDRGAWVLPTLP